MKLRLYGREPLVHVLGPGRRTVIWVQGCPFRCPGCISPDSLPFEGGEEVPVGGLAAWVLAQEGIEGVTFSGGEPFCQAEALCALLDAVRAERDLGAVCYTGYTLEHLRDAGTAPQRALLERIDLLIDGPYVEEQHSDLLWRGSTNQRLILLSERYRALEPGWREADHSAGLEIIARPGGSVTIAGVPPVRASGIRHSVRRPT